jgi:TPR repeat protein
MMRTNQTIPLMAILISSLTACTQTHEPTPTNAQIESIGLQASQVHLPAYIDKLTDWAQQGLPVAQRELAIAYHDWPQHDVQARYWLQKAASGGDVDAQFRLADAFYKGACGLVQNHVEAWKWYENAAQAGNAMASFMLARMAKYGDGVLQDKTLAMHWLMESSRQGNAQAMFLLSNAYAAGEGIGQDAIKAKEWLEKSAAGDYPVAIQALAMSLEGDSHQTDEDSARAGHLIKEARDERLMRWKNYQ